MNTFTRTLVVLAAAALFGLTVHAFAATFQEGAIFGEGDTLDRTALEGAFDYETILPG